MGTSAIVGAAALAAVFSALRWWRVSQREHYLPGRCIRVLVLWITKDATTLIGYVVAGLLVAGSLFVGNDAAAVSMMVLGYVSALLSPLRLAWNPSSKPLARTNRALRLMATTVVLIVALAVLAGALVDTAALAALFGLALVAGAPALVDAACVINKPLEDRFAGGWIRTASAKLASSHARTVAITGSFGKTTTKVYSAHLVGQRLATVATPGSYNNLLGISRTINDSLTLDTDVFIAEMGTYGIGEIREMCRHFPPRIACITSIGDMHLERMGSRANVAQAKSEIVEGADVAILNIDSPELAVLADKLSSSSVRVVRVSAEDRAGADVSVVREGSVARVTAQGLEREIPAVEGHLSNVACAIAISLELGVDLDHVLSRLSSLPQVAHRAVPQKLDDGTWLVDDTYNSNPAGAEAAVATSHQRLSSSASRLWVVTPGFLELGDAQSRENRAFAQATVDRGAHLIAVGRTNRRELLDDVTPGGSTDRGERSWYARPEEARRAVVGQASPGDVILYENDLPDYYP